MKYNYCCIISRIHVCVHMVERVPSQFVSMQVALTVWWNLHSFDFQGGSSHLHRIIYYMISFCPQTQLLRTSLYKSDEFTNPILKQKQHKTKQMMQKTKTPASKYRLNHCAVVISIVCWQHLCTYINSLRQSDTYMLRQWLLAWSSSCYYLNQCWNIVNWTLRIKLQWNFNRNPCMFFSGN